MRAVEVMAAAWERFLGVFDGVGSMVMGSMVGGASDASEFGPSESECAPLAALREFEACLRGVLCGDRFCVLGEAGEDGGLESWVGARAKRAFFTVVGGGVLRWKLARGDRSPLKEE
jgi:hypothetical protein